MTRGSKRPGREPISAQSQGKESSRVGTVHSNCFRGVERGQQRARSSIILGAENRTIVSRKYPMEPSKRTQWTKRDQNQ